MSSHDAPQPPGGPLREDSPDGGLAPDAQREETAPDQPGQPEEDSSGPGSDDDRPIPPVSHEPTQPEEAAALQEENAETALDQPSS